MAELNDDLFGGNLDDKMGFLNDSKKVNADGIYRIDLSKVKDKKIGYKSVLRFLPNLTKDGKLGEAAIEKITHYVDMKNNRDLAGWYDSPKNFGQNQHCPLSSLYFTLSNSKRADLIEKATNTLKFSKKYFSYVLVMEDDQQPETVGKIMVFQYGKTIKDKINSEKTGEITGEPCNVFKLESGKDFSLIVKELSTGEVTYPDYRNSAFKPNITSVSIFNENTNTFKRAPLDENGKIQASAQETVRNFLMKREHELEDFAPKVLTTEQLSKISQISDYLTGKVTSNHSKPSSDDFDLGDLVTSTGSLTAAPSVEEDDFFN